MKKYFHILFDADNTLFDFDKSEETAFDLAVSKTALKVTPEVCADYHEINESLWKLLEKGGIERSRLKTERFRLLFEKHGITDDSYLSAANDYIYFLGLQTFEIDGVYEMLSRLKDHYGIYVITNGLTSVQESRFSRSRLTTLTNGAFISEKIGFAKPEKSYFDCVISSIGDRDLSHYIVVGDSLTSDIDGAIAYGIDCIWYNRNGASPSGRCPTYTVSKITDVEKIL